MADRISRRNFNQVVGNALLVSASGVLGGCAEKRQTVAPESSKTAAVAPRGKLSMTNGRVDLRVPVGAPAGETWRYGLTFPFQLAPRTAATFCNIRGKRGHDFEVGTDVIVFDDVAKIRPEQAIALSRNHEEANPHSNPPGKRSIMVKYPVRGGFVPLGAKLSDGTPHPHAGTGFGTSQAMAWTLNQDRSYDKAEAYEYMELSQLRYDGKSFQVTGTERIPYERLLPGATLANPGLSNAIPDGEDLLFPMSSAAERPTAAQAGLVRWKRGEQGWRPISWTPITPMDQSFEPTLIRDVDGSFLFCARAASEPEYHDIRVWRSDKGGEAWKKIIHVRGLISSAPICLNQASDGTPYIAANLYEVFLKPVPPPFSSRRDKEGRERLGGWLRDKLCLWPLNAERTGLDAPTIVRDCTAEFGPAPGGVSWNADHASSKTVQLADGGWHDVVGLRICARAEVWGGIDPPEQTGAYLEEVSCSGPVHPGWSF
jgi:hypothetical protein